MDYYKFVSKVSVLHSRTIKYRSKRLNSITENISFQEFIELQRIRKCTTQKGDIFVLEEQGTVIDSLSILFTFARYCIDPQTKQPFIRKYKSSMVSIHCTDGCFAFFLAENVWDLFDVVFVFCVM